MNPETKHPLRAERINLLNKRFCKGAKELRYIHKIRDGDDIRMVFSNDKVVAPQKGSWLRSIKYKDENAYLFVLDIDSKEFTEKIYEATKGLYTTIRNYLHKKPLMKVSGSKGMQLILKLNFNKNVDEHKAVEHMRNLAYTLWRISTPDVRNTINFDEVPGIDCAMFTKGRMLRSFCKHLVSDNFSVPVTFEDTYTDVVDRMKLDKSLLDFKKFPELDFNDDLIIYKYENSGTTVYLDEKDLKKYKISTSSGFKPDAVYGRMPQILRTVVRSSDVGHDKKWPILSYLRIFEKMEPAEILEWLLEHSGWELSNIKGSLYQITWTCKWCDKSSKEIVSRDDFKIHYLPLPTDVIQATIEDWGKRRYTGYSIKYMTRLFYDYFRMYLGDPSEAVERSEELRISQ